MQAYFRPQFLFLNLTMNFHRRFLLLTILQSAESKWTPLATLHHFLLTLFVSVELARQLLRDGIEDRQSSRFMALIVLVEYAAKTGRHDAALELLDNLFPTLMDDPPHGFEKDPVGMMFVGLALLQSGDVERGSYLLQKYMDFRSPRDEAYGVSRSTIAVKLALGETDEAREILPEFEKKRYYWEFNRTLLERSHLFDPLREEPAFIEMLESYRTEAEEQRTILQAMTQ